MGVRKNDLCRNCDNIHWSDDEHSYLVERYPVDGAARVAEALSRSHDNVIRRANKFKIALSDETRMQQFRERASKPELKLRGMLDAAGVDYESSAFVKPKFIVDIRIGKLIIELDGDYWHGHPRYEPLTERMLKQQSRDRVRNKYLAKCGYTVVRIWESDLSEDRVTSILQEHGVI
jgi:G:T-mismatch repair DNA endonuclease (very short patch repair protein)